MSASANTIALLVAKGFAGQELVEVLRAIELDYGRPVAERTARQERNRRYYAKRLNKTSDKTSEQDAESVLEASESADPRAPIRERGLCGEDSLFKEIPTVSRKIDVDEPIPGLIDEPPAYPKPKRDTSADDAIVDQFVEGWGRLAAQCGLAGVRAVTNKRRSHILARARDLTSVLDFPSPATGFADLFAKIRAGPQLLGQTGLAWKCDVDWVVTEANFLKIMEGKYAKTNKPNGQFQHAAR